MQATACGSIVGGSFISHVSNKLNSACICIVYGAFVPYPSGWYDADDHRPEPSVQASDAIIPKYVLGNLCSTPDTRRRALNGLLSGFDDCERKEYGRHTLRHVCYILNTNSLVH